MMDSGKTRRLLLLAVPVIGLFYLLRYTANHAGHLQTAPTHLSALSQIVNDTKREELVQDKYSIVISTYNRAEHLNQFLHKYGSGSLPRLDAIFVAWGLGGHDPPAWIDTSGLAVPVYYERAKRNSLTERFRKPSKMRTHAGFWVDDDLAFRPQDIEFAFDTYLDLGRHDHRIVGFSGRLVEKLRSGDWAYKVFALSYSMILTNAAFLDTQMLAWFWKEDERIRKSIEYVDEHMNCEDILFNFAVSDQNKLSPILVESKDLVQVATSGISNQPGHYLERSACVRAFTEIWGNPLKTSHVKITPNTREKSPKTVPLDEKYRPTGKTWAEDLQFVEPQ